MTVILKDHSNTFLSIDGNVPLRGSIDISGSKNASLPILVSSLLFNGAVEISNLPNITDVAIMLKLIAETGAEVYSGSGVAVVDASSMRHHRVHLLANKIRSSILLMGPILRKLGKVVIPLPGGCKIGERGIDIHLKALQMMGAEIETFDSRLEVVAKGPLRSIDIRLPLRSVGATQHIIMTAVLCDGVTTIDNCAKEPEVVELCDFLNSCGAKITGAGADRISIHGVSSLRPKRCVVLGDRMEAGTYAIAIAATKGSAELRNISPSQMPELVELFDEVGVGLSTTQDGIFVSARKPLESIDVMTSPYPGFPTDLQAPITALFACAGDGKQFSVGETVHTGRFGHVLELNKMGANIQVQNHTALISSKDKIFGNRVKGVDLRASKALVIAALSAQGNSRVYGLEHLYRGYENLVDKLKQLGGRIKEIAE